VSEAAAVGIIVLATVAVAVSIFSCTEVTVGVKGTVVVVGAASGVGDWVVDGVPVDEDTFDSSVEPVEEGDSLGAGVGSGVAEDSGGLVKTGLSPCDGALVTVAPSEGAGVITCSFEAGSVA
jgi:hypothetical protein